VKLALLVLALLLLLSLVLGELPLGDASGCVLLPFTLVLALGGATLVLVRGKGRLAIRIAFAIAILLMGLHICVGPLYYRGRPIESRVVDESGDPVPDAQVVATWETNHGGIFARVETRSDRAGYFTIPAWSPRPRLPFTFLDPTQPTLEVTAPGFAKSAERDDSPNERVAAVSGEQWRRPEIVLYKP
jgi:hypothetical protein